MKVRMVSLKAHTYAGKRLAVGAEFEASGRKDAKLLQAIGRASLMQVAEPEPVVQPIRRARLFQPVAVSDVVPDVATDEVKPKRVYRRRNLTAE